MHTDALNNAAGQANEAHSGDEVSLHISSALLFLANAILRYPFRNHCRYWVLDRINSLMWIVDV